MNTSNRIDVPLAEIDDITGLRILFALSAVLVAPPLAAQSNLHIEFAETAAFAFAGAGPPDLVAAPFTPDEKTQITRLVTDSEAKARPLLPDLPARIRIVVARVDRDLSSVGGASGRADAPGELLLEISGRVDGVPAAGTGIRHTLFHELHHLARGWTIRENRFGPGIAIAAVNEGLAEVFAETQTGLVLAASEYPENVADWAREIMVLPTNADYGAWMFSHPDGRLAIGYRTGRYLVHRAMATSGKDVLELSQLAPAEIIELARIER